MAVNGTGVSQNAQFAAIVGSTWGTSATLTGNKLIKAESLGPLTPQQDMIQDGSISYPMPKYVFPGQKNVELNFSCKLQWSGAFWIPVFQLVGTDNGSVATGVYTHYADVANTVNARFFTAAAYIATTTPQYYEWPSVKTTSFEINTGGDGFMQLNCSGIASDVLVGADATNDSTDFGNCTYSDEDGLVSIGHCRVNMNAYNGADFNSSGDGTDRIYPNGVSIKFSRPYERDFRANRTTSNSRLYQTDEPRANGIHSDILLTLDFAETDVQTYFEDFQDQNIKKAEVLFYYSADYQIKFQFPHLVPLQPSYEIGGVGRIPTTRVFQACACNTGPTGMSGVTEPFRLTVINTQDTTTYHDGGAIS